MSKTLQTVYVPTEQGKRFAEMLYQDGGLIKYTNTILYTEQEHQAAQGYVEWINRSLAELSKEHKLDAIKIIIKNMPPVCNEAAQQALSAAPTTQNGWVSVEDRLPEYGIAVLLIISNGAMTIGYLKSATKTYRYRQWQLFGDMEDTLCVQEHDQVTHWQPLPLKPQP
jgi:hypothetical protein